jgi:polysaccharide export outer membrane protein
MLCALIGVFVVMAAQTAQADDAIRYNIRSNDVLEILIPLNVDLELLGRIPFSEDQFEMFGNEIFAKKTIAVDPYGNIFLPLLGYIPVQGKTPQEFSAELTEKLKKYVQNTRCEVLVKKSAPYCIYVFGEVSKPGKYEIDREITAFEAIAMVGGFTKDANKKKIKVIRRIQNGYKIFVINLYDAIKDDNLEENIIVKNDDLIIVMESFF